jgi:hypothetical protein
VPTDKAPSFDELTKTMTEAVAKIAQPAAEVVTAVKRVLPTNAATRKQISNAPTFALELPEFDCSEFASAKAIIAATLQHALSEMLNQQPSAKALAPKFAPTQFEVKEISCRIKADDTNDAGLAAVFAVHTLNEDQMGVLMVASSSLETVANYFGTVDGKNAWTTKFGHMLAINNYVLVN